MSEKIRQYWDERAQKNKGSLTGTTDDVYFRELEIKTILNVLQMMGPINLKKGANILDVGCGDGNTLIKIAERFPDFNYTGIDYAEGMVNNANIALAGNPKLSNRIKILRGDALELSKQFSENKFDLVMTDRCLINLESFELQARVIREISSIIPLGGYYLGIENFEEGQLTLNSFRDRVGLSQLPVRWHNLYFKEKQFVSECEKYFTVVEIMDFSSSYYFATRIIYSAMCKMQAIEPDYQHDIHKLAVNLPWIGCLSPIRMAIMRKR